jgi:hypothetical protein
MATERSAGNKRDVLSLAGRVVHFYRSFNNQDWPRCYGYIDPRLTTAARVGPDEYAQSMQAFFEAYGPIQEVNILKLTIYPGGQARDDTRDFAYAVISWKDKMNEYHHFRERWIKDRGKWFTRVIGLVPKSSNFDIENN